MSPKQPQEQPEEAPDKPQKSKGEQALEKIDRLEKILLERLPPLEKSSKEAKTGNEQAAKGGHDHAIPVPSWRFCPTCKDDSTAGLPGVESKPVAKCSKCGQFADPAWERCPTCGAKDE